MRKSFCNPTVSSVTNATSNQNFLTLATTNFPKAATVHLSFVVIVFRGRYGFLCEMPSTFPMKAFKRGWGV